MAERLLQYAISHHLGATEEIKARVNGWRGAIKTTPSLETLLDVARNGDDLRVRAAAIEIELAPGVCGHRQHRHRRDRWRSSQGFHHDPSSAVRINGGGCGLAHCGMLTRAQRMLAIPGLIEMVEDKALDKLDVSYGYRSLREITDQSLPDNAQQWREWYGAQGAKTTDKFRRFEDGRKPY
jgi:hypothetical protein